MCDSPSLNPARASLARAAPAAEVHRQIPATWKTPPPAMRMRCCSSFRSGLWSWERRTAAPPRHRTARQSPTCAQKSLRSSSSLRAQAQPRVDAHAYVHVGTGMGVHVRAERA